MRLWSASWRNHVRRGPHRELQFGRCAENLQRDRAAGAYPVGGAAVDERHSGHPMRHGEPREAGNLGDLSVLSFLPQASRDGATLGRRPNPLPSIMESPGKSNSMGFQRWFSVGFQ